MSDSETVFRAETCRLDRIVDGTVEELTCVVSVLNTVGNAVGSRKVSFTRYGDEFHWDRTAIASANDAPGPDFISITQEACVHVDSHFQPDVVANGVAGWDRSSE